MPTTGRQLRKLRRDSELGTKVITEALQISRTTLWIIEKSAVVAPETAEQYRQAVRDAIVSAKRPENAA